MEIYNEDINDLFAVENQKLQIHESLEVIYWQIIWNAIASFSTTKTLIAVPL